MTKQKGSKERFMENPEFREEYARVDEEYGSGRGADSRPHGGEADAGGACPAARHDPARHCAAGGRMSPSFATLCRYAEAIGTENIGSSSRNHSDGQIESDLGSYARSRRSVV